MHLKQVLVPSDDTALNWTITPLHHYEEGWNSERPFCPGRPLCRQPSDGISFGAFVTVKEDFLLLSHDLTLKIIEKNKTKAMIKKNKTKQPNVLCMCIICMAGTGFIVFGTITRLLLNMLNVKRKQTLGKCGKPITENVSAGDGEAQGGTEEHVPPPFSNCSAHTDDALSWEKIQLLRHYLYFYIYSKMTLLSPIYL